MKYKKRQKYKYTLHSEEKIETHISVSQAYDSPFLSLSKQGVLTIKKGYAWDGASGPALDTLALTILATFSYFFSTLANFIAAHMTSAIPTPTFIGGPSGAPVSDMIPP